MEWIKRLFASTYTISKEEADAIMAESVRQMKPPSQETLEKLKQFRI